VKVGIVGCGEVSKVHIEALKDTEKCMVVSVCDLIKSKAEALAKRYSIPHTYTDLSLMLQKEKLDLIHIVTPPQVHARLAIEAMNARCNVLVEKPMCMTVREADQMINAAKRNNVKLGVVHSFLFTPGIRKALKSVRQGEIGDLLWADTVISIKSLLDWVNAPGFPMWYAKLPGGLFGEIIPHGLYVQLAFLGNVRKIFGVTKKIEKPSELVPFSELQVLMDCENGLGGLFLSTRIRTPYTVIMVSIIGTRGLLLVNVPTGTVIKMKLGSSMSTLARARMNLEPASHLIKSSASLAAKTLLRSIEHHMTHKILIKEFVESIQRGSKPPVTPEEGREVVRVTNLIWKNILT